MANDRGFSFEDSCEGGRFYARSPLHYFSTCPYVAVIPGFHFCILASVDRLYGIGTQGQ
jgi:hypothetical protein